ncbi:MAG: ABC transporter substrate-binding protein [Clostridiales bacterium]|nr:ABC transporter substrate-binding protein [Clostridiales bacterium]
MKYRRYMLVLLVLILGIVFIFPGCGQQKNRKVRLMEVTHSVFYAPQYVAIHEGYFEEEGIDIELSTGEGADKVMTAVLAGQVEIGFMGPEAAIYVYNEGKEDHAEIFAQLTQTDGSFLVGREPEPDFKWENLRGSTIIGGRQGGVPEMTLEYVLKKHGLTPGVDVEVLTNIQFALMAGAFTGGTGDYVTLFEPVAAALENVGTGHVLASVGVAGGNIPFTAYAAKKTFIKENNDLIQGFTNAITKGLKFVNERPPEDIAKAIMPAFPDNDLDLLTQVAKRYKEQGSWPDHPALKEEDLNHLQDIMEMAGELDQRAPYDKLVNNHFALKAAE